MTDEKEIITRQGDPIVFQGRVVAEWAVSMKLQNPNGIKFAVPRPSDAVPSETGEPLPFRTVSVTPIRLYANYGLWLADGEEKDVRRILTQERMFAARNSVYPPEPALLLAAAELLKNSHFADVFVDRGEDRLEWLIRRLRKMQS